MPPARFRRIALAGCALLGACNDTRDLAPASPDTPWQFEPSKEAPAPPAPAASRGPAVHGAGEHGSPVAVARRHRPQPCLFARRADRYRPAPQPGDARRLGTGAAGGDQCRHRARRLSSGADGERARRLGARRIPVPQQSRSARLHHLQRPGSIPATHRKLSAARFRRPRSRGRSGGPAFDRRRTWRSRRRISN